MLAGPSQAGKIYKYVDSQGVTHYSNVPNDTRYKLAMVIKDTPQTQRPSSYTPLVPLGQGGYAIGFSGKGLGTTGSGNRPFSVNEKNRQFYTPHIAQIARKYSLDPLLLHAVISAESAFNPTARSPKGAMGLMQLMPATARRFGVYNAWDPVANIEGGARYLRWLLDQFQDSRLALAAYNAGEGAVMRYGNRIPPFPETRTYVTRVQRFYTHYQRFN
ncbi:MAG: lytic transglycosylase domain-containing protein [Gammaproteobacteria bacterium]|nr:lytic transglycosylase domain-containing protein [Gammaproteobacteria bacterium]MCP5458659.1 lytic transglycosylase domain-containing protein [Gammaproteobacteria bacterium]